MTRILPDRWDCLLRLPALTCLRRYHLMPRCFSLLAFAICNIALLCNHSATHRLPTDILFAACLRVAVAAFARTRDCCRRAVNVLRHRTIIGWLPSLPACLPVTAFTPSFYFSPPRLRDQADP